VILDPKKTTDRRRVLCRAVLPRTLEVFPRANDAKLVIASLGVRFVKDALNPQQYSDGARAGVRTENIIVHVVNLPYTKSPLGFRGNAGN